MTVNGHPRYQCPLKSVAVCHLVAVHAIFAIGAEVAGDDVIRGHGEILTLRD